MFYATSSGSTGSMRLPHHPVAAIINHKIAIILHHQVAIPCPLISMLPCVNTGGPNGVVATAVQNKMVVILLQLQLSVSISRIYRPQYRTSIQFFQSQLTITSYFKNILSIWALNSPF